MRLSVLDFDPGYPMFATLKGRGMFPTVLLDGAPLTKVITADEERRTVVRYVTDERGRCVLTKDRQAVQTEELHGNVVIVLPDGIRPPVEA